MKLDHLAIVARDLDEGCAWTEERLGCLLRPGGRHVRFATWNRLIRLAEGEYLEVIAPDPDAPLPGGPRWFGLDAAPRAPRLGNWIVATDRIERDGIAEVGPVVSLARGDLRWRIAVPEDGGLPFDGVFPTLIEWLSGGHPSARLPDDGLRLTRLEIRSERAGELSARLAGRLSDPRVIFLDEPGPVLSAVIETPSGEVRL